MPNYSIMGAKLQFSKLQIQNPEVQVDFGFGPEPFDINLAKTSGISIPDECESFKNIKVYGKNISVGDLIYAPLNGHIDSRADKIHISKNASLIGEGLYGQRFSEVTFDNDTDTIRDWFLSNCTIDKLTIPEGLTNREPSAFGYSDIVQLIMPTNTVGCFDSNPFNHVDYLKLTGAWDNNIGTSTLCSISNNIDLSDVHGLTISPDFYRCRNLESLTLPNSVTSIKNYAFLNCTSLTSITIPDSVTTIGEGAFHDCKSLTSINIPDSVTSIGRTTFNNCTGLTSINIPNSITSIGDSTFANCTSLISMDIPNSVTSIPNYTFNNCRNLTSITIPDSVTSIGERAFFGCSSLTSITIPDSVTSIRNEAFKSCTNLSELNINVDITRALSLLRNHPGDKFQELVISKLDIPLNEFVNFASSEEYTGILNYIGENSVNRPIALKIIPSNPNGIWTHNELVALSNAIKTKQIYVDLRPTNLTHEVEQGMIDELLSQEGFDPLFGEEGYFTSGNLTTEDLRPFPRVFSDNTYITGITMPEGDNYSASGIFEGCANLKHVSFAGTKLWKIGIYTADDNDPYYIWEGQDNFKYKLDDWITILETEEEFMSILTANGSTASLMWYYDCWVDTIDNPEATEPAPNEIELEGVRNLPQARVLSLNEDVEVIPTEIISNNTDTSEIAPATTINFDDNVVVENGIIHLDGTGTVTVDINFTNEGD